MKTKKTKKEYSKRNPVARALRAKKVVRITCARRAAARRICRQAIRDEG